MFETKADLNTITHTPDMAPDMVALQFAREIFSLKQRLIAAGFDSVAEQLGEAIVRLDEIWMTGATDEDIAEDDLAETN